MNRTDDYRTCGQACHQDATQSGALEALLLRAVHLLKEAGREPQQRQDLLFVFALEASFSRAAAGVAKLDVLVPSLGHVFASMRDLLARSFLRNHVSRLEFSLLLKAAFELLLMALCDHFAIQAAQAATSLMDRLQLLKPNLQPPSRLNCFFELKELVNYAAHPKDAQCSVSLTLLDDALHAFVKVTNECVAVLLQGGTSVSECATATAPTTSTTIRATQRTPTTVARNVAAAAPLPPRTTSFSATLGRASNINKTKTRLCAYWQAGGACPYADQCRFAHGRAELVATVVDATQSSG